jgi:predicted nuclease of predicted toxin-antitoxin system
MVKFIADVNVEKPLIDYLNEIGYDVTWVADYDCEMLDKDLLRLSKRERRILLTNDKDFGELIYLQKSISAGVILFRVRGQRVEEKKRLIKKLIDQHGNKLSRHFIVITEKKIRIIPMEARE